MSRALPPDPPSDPPSDEDDDMPPPDDDEDFDEDDFDDASAGEEDFDPPDDEDDDDFGPPDDEDEFDDDEDPPLSDGSGEPPLPSDDEDDDFSGEPPDDDDEDDPEGDSIPGSDPDDFDGSEPDDFGPDDESDDAPESADPMGSDDDDDGPPPPPSEESDSTVGPRGNFVLPVRTSALSKFPDSAEENDENKEPSTKNLNFNLDALSSGLTINNPPQVLAGETPPQQKSTVTIAGDVSVMSEPSGDDTPGTSGLESEDVDVGKVREEALEQGFIEAEGRFEGDEYEKLYLKIPENSKLLQIIIPTGQKVDFDLSQQTFVFEDSNDSKSFILDHFRNIIVYRFENETICRDQMKKMPPEVFLVPDLTEDEKKTLTEDEATVASKSSNKTKKSDQPYRPNPVAGEGGKYAVSHKKGQSVEDILEFDIDGEYTNKSSTQLLDSMFNTRLHFASISTPERRKELLDTYIRKPKYSLRHVGLLCEWINTLHIWPNALNISGIHREFCNGLLLARLIKKLNPTIQLTNITEKALAKKSAMQNIEEALGVVWRSKSLNNSRIPAANDIYLGKTSKIAIFLNEIFGVYVQKPLFRTTLKMLKWYHIVLRQYMRPLDSNIFQEGDLSYVWPHFQSGVAIFCVLYHFFGNRKVGNGENKILIDPLKITWEPRSICDFRDNVNYVFVLLEALEVDIVWTAEDWLCNPDTEFVILQLNYIYQKFKDNQCSLPPAQGSEPGVTSGPNGEPIVVGIIFKDTVPKNIRTVKAKYRKAVLLGHDNDSMPLLPVDRAGKKGRFISNVCPKGMVHNNALLPRISVELREKTILSTRDTWDQHASLEELRPVVKNKQVLTLLREHNKRNETDGTSTLTALANSPTTEPVYKKGMGTLVASKLVAGNKSFFEQNQNSDKNKTVGSPKSPKSPHKTYSAASFKVYSKHNQSSGTSLATSSVGASTLVNELRHMDIEQAINGLEQEMQSSQVQLNEIEEDLAARYLELEASAEQVSLEEYEETLNELENERKSFEEEKLKLQDHFSRKLSAIKKIYSETEQEQKQYQEDDVASSVGGSVMNQPISNNLSTWNTKKPMKFTKHPKEDPKQLKEAEKGWIKQTAKKSTHNYHLKNMQEASATALKEVLTPKTWKAKERKFAESKPEKPVPRAWGLNAVELPKQITLASEKIHKKTLGSGRKKGPPGNSAENVPQEELIALAFDKFKHRLHITSMKWLKSKQQTGRERLQDIIASSPNTPKVELISLPEKSFRPPTNENNQNEPVLEPILSPEQQLELLKISQAIREEELHRLFYEDERRKMVISENFLSSQQELWGVNEKAEKGEMSVSFLSDVKGNIFGTPMGRSRDQREVTPSTQSSGGIYQNPTISKKKEIPPDPHEIKSTCKWLGVGRTLLMADRTPKEYLFSLSKSSQPEHNTDNLRGNQDPFEKAMMTRYYSFEWREVMAVGRTNQSYLVGFVTVEDMLNIVTTPQDTFVFTIHIKSSTKALKNAKGRTAVTIRCSNPGECAKYVTSLQYLKMCSGS